MSLQWSISLDLLDQRVLQVVWWKGYTFDTNTLITNTIRRVSTICCILVKCVCQYCKLATVDTTFYKFRQASQRERRVTEQKCGAGQL